VVSALENQKARLIISDLSQRRLALHEVRDGLVVNRQKTRVAVAQVRGNKQLAIEIDFANPDKVKEGPLYDSIDKLAFSSDGDSVTYIGKRANKGYLILDGKEEHLSLAEMWEPPVVRPDKKGAGLILISEGGWYFHQTYGGVPKTLKKYQEAAQLVYSGDSSHYAYCARNGKQHFVVADGKEGPIYDMVINPDFSPDGRFLVYRARKDGKRFVVVADTNGKVTREHPVYEQIFRPVFTPDGKSVAYGVKDGNQLIWKVEQLDK
jgi:WD40 repeat protein